MSKQKRSRWMQRHLDDNFVKKAQVDGYRSRAAYKLIELNEKDKLIKPGMCVVDLGAAPGGWTQVACELVGDKGRVVALDILPMDSFANAEVIQGDFCEDQVYQQLLDTLNGQLVDLVISDMAPNISGVRAIDQPKAMHLVELALDFACQVLKPGGDFVTKAFEGEGITEFRAQVKQAFAKMLVRKPDASRSESRELFVIGKSRNA